MILHTLLIVYPLVNPALHGHDRTIVVSLVVLTAKNTKLMVPYCILRKVSNH